MSEMEATWRTRGFFAMGLRALALILLVIAWQAAKVLSFSKLTSEGWILSLPWTSQAVCR